MVIFKLHGEENCHGIVKFRGKYVLEVLENQKLCNKISPVNMNLELV